MDPARLSEIDRVVAEAIAAKNVPGAVVLVGRRGRVVFAKSYGNRSIEPTVEPMTRDTIFDMASLTKPVATATSVMLLIEQGRLRPRDAASKHIPAFGKNGKQSVTVDQLLRHRSGLIPDNPLRDYLDGPESAWDRINALSLDDNPGERFVYSDVNFLVLGRIVEAISQTTLDQFTRDRVFVPLGMKDTGFRRISEGKRADIERTAPTEKIRGAVRRGEVHDPRSWLLDGVAGHAGLFSTADDLAIYANMLLSGGVSHEGSRILSPMTVRLMTDAADTPKGQRRGLGWDVDTGFSSPRGDLFGVGGHGHTGYTGTSIWIDPDHEIFVIVLANRVHPVDRGDAGTLRAKVATIVASSILDARVRPESRTSPTPATSILRQGDVLCGVDVLASNGFEILRGKRVGLITNHTGKTRTGKPAIDAIADAADVKLVALFSPEHGIRGALDRPVADARDEKTGLPIHSLYGKNRKPTKESLKDVQILVYDIQDIGTRFYTYISTLGLAIEAAAENGIPIVVLDRPNPIGGLVVAGPTRDPDFASFIAFHELPVRHGMTVGELANLFNVERSIGANLRVIPCRGWSREMLFDRVGLEWTNPSPNMRSLTQAMLYPGVGLLEATNLATGRGTDTPFERVGAPWINPVDFAKALNAMNLSGVRFVPVRFTPKERQYANQECGGVYIAVSDWSAFDPIDVGVALALKLRELHPKTWQPVGMLRLMTDRPAHEAILAGNSLAEVRATWERELSAFRRVRSKYLLYR